MKNSFTAIAALAATAFASAVTYDVCEGDCGSVEIVSHCDQDIYFSNVPSQGDAVGTTCFKAGDSYSQTFTAMPNKAGWSMKLSPDESFPSDNTQQYEYTWQGGDDPVWYDMSYVNGQPYAGQWNFTSSNDEVCNPTDSAYRYSTDDAYGMQASCPSSVTLTLHLCPENAGSSSSGSSSGSSSSSAAAPSSTESSSSTSSYLAPSTYSTTQAYTAPSSSSSQTTFATSTSTWSRPSHTGGYGNKVQVDNSGDVQVAAASTTAVAVTTSVAGGPVVTETQVQVVTQVQTMVVTARDAAPSAHAHKLRHEHRHPHGGRA